MIRGDSIPIPNDVTPDGETIEVIVPEPLKKRKKIVTAIITDKDGHEVYHVVSTVWSWLVLATLITLMGICIGLSFVILQNSRQIDKINQEIYQKKKEGQ